MNIRKTVLALGSALMLFATTLNAQENPWSFGVKAGLGMSGLQGLGEAKVSAPDGTLESEMKGKWGFIGTGGVTVGYNFHENVGLGLEVLYSGLGGKLEEKEAKLGKLAGQGEKTVKGVFSTHNLVVPLMVKFFPMGCDPEEGILNIHLGVQGELPLFDASVKKSKMDDFDKLEKEKTFKKEFLAPLTASFIGGVGYEFPGIGLSIEVRGSLGLMNVMKNTDDAKAFKEVVGLKEDQKLTNNSLAFSLGYNFAKLLMN